MFQEVPLEASVPGGRIAKTSLAEAVEITYAVSQASLHRRIRLLESCSKAFLCCEQGECPAPLHHRYSSFASTQGTSTRT